MKDDLIILMSESSRLKVAVQSNSTTVALVIFMEELVKSNRLSTASTPNNLKFEMETSHFSK
jgi:hypothetical protein